MLQTAGHGFLSECWQLGRVGSFDRVGVCVYKMIAQVLLGLLLLLLLMMLMMMMLMVGGTGGALVMVNMVLTMLCRFTTDVRNALDRHQHVRQQVVQFSVAIILWTSLAGETGWRYAGAL